MWLSRLTCTFAFSAVIPAKPVPAGFKPGAGIQASFNGILDSRLRGNDGSTPFEKVNLDKTVLFIFQRINTH
jgi:hypothetical protein